MSAADSGVITLVLHAHLCRYANDRERVELSYREGASIADYVRTVDIPTHEYYAIVRNGQASRDFAAVLQPGEVVELLPVLSGG